MGRTIRRRWREIMERFIRLNRSILDCDLAKGGCRLDEEGITAIEDEVAELVRIIAQSHRGDIPRESAAFAEFRRTCLARALRSAVPYREGPTEMQSIDV